MTIWITSIRFYECLIYYVIYILFKYYSLQIHRGIEIDELQKYLLYIQTKSLI